MSQIALFAPPWVPRVQRLAWYREGDRWTSILVLSVHGEVVRGAAIEGTRSFHARDLRARPWEVRRG